jgi:hypothetical protein
VTSMGLTEAVLIWTQGAMRAAALAEACMHATSEPPAAGAVLYAERG